MQRFIFLLLLNLFAVPAWSACTFPDGIEGEQVYNSTHKTMQFCDGSTWYSMKGVPLSSAPSAPTDPCASSPAVKGKFLTKFKT